MKISPVLPIAFSSLLTASLAAPLRLRYPSPVEAEKRADTFLQPKSPSFDQKIHEVLNFGAGEPLLRRNVEEIAKRADSFSQQIDNSGTSSASSSGEAEGATSGLGPPSTKSFDEVAHDTLNFGGSGDPLLFKKDAASQVEKRQSLLPSSSSSSSFSTANFDNAIHDVLPFGGDSDPLMGSSSAPLNLFRRAEEAFAGAARIIARAFHA